MMPAIFGWKVRHRGYGNLAFDDAGSASYCSVGRHSRFRGNDDRLTRE